MYRLTAIALALSLAFVSVADAAAKPKKPMQVTSAERAKIYAWALTQCRKKYGATLVERVQLKLNYRRYVCWIH
jgi:hypothetical protein